MKITSKTIWGALIGAIGYVMQPGILDIIPAKPAGIITAIGGLLAALGLRHAIDKQNR